MWVKYFFKKRNRELIKLAIYRRLDLTNKKWGQNERGRERKRILV